MDYLSQIKVKGLVLGPIHTVQAGQSSTLELTSINPEFGSESQLISLLDRAHRKGDSLVCFEGFQKKISASADNK